MPKSYSINHALIHRLGREYAKECILDAPCSTRDINITYSYLIDGHTLIKVGEMYNLSNEGARLIVKKTVAAIEQKLKGDVNAKGF